MSRRLYPDVHKCRALIVDGNPTSRSLLSGMLRSMGLTHVTQTSRVTDARRMLESRPFDIVLCDYHFDSSPISGQVLLDDLRRAQLLPYSTVFVMVTGEASYALVAEAAEAALDSYLLKPHSASALEQRLLQARHRKKTLHHIFAAIECGDLARAADACRQRFVQRASYGLYAARVGAELNLRLGRFDEARSLFTAVLALHSAPWARLGLARVELESGELRQAHATLDALTADEPAYADAYDVMGRVLLEQGELTRALTTYRHVSTLTPASITRLQRQGVLAFHSGQADEAQHCLERATRIGLNSKMFDCQSLVLLALLHFDRRDKKPFLRACDDLARAVQRQGENARLHRLHAIALTLRAVHERDAALAASVLVQLAGQRRDTGFDFEAAINLVGVLARLRHLGLELPDAQSWVADVARRFCVSKAATELLCMAAHADVALQQTVRGSHAQITTMAEKAMSHSVGGHPRATVAALLLKGGETLNAKLIELAELVRRRHADKLDDSASLALAIGALRRQYCPPGSRVALGTTTGRAAGSLTIRC